MAENLESIAGLFGFGEKKPDQPPRFAKVTAISGDTVTVTVGASNVDAVRCCDCAVADVVLLETMPSGQLAAVGVKGYNGGGGGAATTWYGTCSTSASTAAKVVTCPGFTLSAGAIIVIYFSTAQTNTAPTLNVNGTGAKGVWRNGAVTANGNALVWPQANTIAQFMYDGSVWHFVANSAIMFPPRGNLTNTNLNLRGGGMSHYLSTSSTTTGKPMGNGHIIHMSYESSNYNGSQFYVPNNDTSFPQWRTNPSGTWTDWQTFYTTASCGASYYGTSSTAAGTAAKVVTCAGFVLAAGAAVHVDSSTANTVTSGMTLNVNSTGAKDVYRKGSTSGLPAWAANSMLTFVYDGTYWRFAGGDF